MEEDPYPPPSHEISPPPLIFYAIIMPILWGGVMVVACGCVRKAHRERTRMAALVALGTIQTHTQRNNTQSEEVQPVSIFIDLHHVGENRYTVLTADLVLSSTTQTIKEPCYVCYETEATAVLLNCGHSGICVQCAKKLKPRLCPICRKPIEKTVQLLDEEEGVVHAMELYV